MLSKSCRYVWMLGWGLTAVAAAEGSMIVVDYTFDAGGSTSGALNGLSARGTYSTTDTLMTVLLENTSTGAPADFTGANSLLVSIAFNLPEGIRISSGDTAVIGPDSRGLGTWELGGVGESVVSEWAWTNQGGGDMLVNFLQVLTTSSGNTGLTLFGGGAANVDGPWGGITASPPVMNIPPSQRAVSNSILFGLTLSAPLTEEQLRSMASESIVEFGSDARYLRVPEPSSLALLAAGAMGLVSRRLRR